MEHSKTRTRKKNNLNRTEIVVGQELKIKTF